MLSVFIDTMVICTLTAFVVLSSGVGDDGGVTGAPLVKDAMATVLGQPVAQVFISVALFLFAFTTLVGNFYYAEVNFRFLLRNITMSTGCSRSSAPSPRCSSSRAPCSNSRSRGIWATS